jgi:hypothetical protein|tara:strand:+ start:544 stop:894 length:351 start_codon:yes stop_codon:yes gene_type:complete
MGMVQNINISDRLTDCIANDWMDLIEHLDGITLALMDVPEAGQTMRNAMIEWCAEVDTRTETLARADDPNGNANDNDSHSHGGVQGGLIRSEASAPLQNTASFLRGNPEDKFGCES